MGLGLMAENWVGVPDSHHMLTPPDLSLSGARAAKLKGSLDSCPGKSFPPAQGRPLCWGWDVAKTYWGI